MVGAHREPEQLASARREMAAAPLRLLDSPGARRSAGRTSGGGTTGSRRGALSAATGAARVLGRLVVSALFIAAMAATPVLADWLC